MGGPDRPSVYSEAGLDSVDERQRRELRETIVFMLAVNAGTAVVAFLVTGSLVVALVGFAVLCVVGGAFVVHFARRERVLSEVRREGVRQLLARVEELDPEDAFETLDRIHAARRRVYRIALVGGTLCLLLVIPGAALSTGNVVGTLIGVGIYTGVLVWLCLNGMRKLDRDFEQARADTAELLATRRPDAGGA